MPRKTRPEGFRRQAVYSLSLIALVVAVGTTGYVILEGWGAFDALYMTVITITTIGYGEVYKLSRAGRVFTVFLIFFSVGAVFYSLNNAARIIIEGELKDIFGRRKLKKRLYSMKDHYIICGYGRMGGIIARELSEKGAEFVIVEKAREVVSEVGEEFTIVEGDATKDDTLREAGIERAKGFISVLSTDADNLYAVLSARELNPNLLIVARAGEEGAGQKLIRAGADRVVSPYREGGLRIAHSVLKPAVVDFVEFATKAGNIDLQMEEVRVEEGSAFAGRSLDECGIGRELGVIVVAIKGVDGEMRMNPIHSSKIQAGDTLIVLGEMSKLKALEDSARRGKGAP